MTPDLHSAVGIWTVVLVAMWSVTGLYFVFRTEFRSAVNWISPITVSQPPTSDPVGAGREPRPTWRALIERARQQAPDEFVARVVVPATAQSPFLVLFSEVRPTPIGPGELRSVYLDQYTGALLQEPPPAARTLGDTIMTWVGPLHVGNFGGVGVRLVWLITGLGPVLLAVTGLTMWWTRVVSPRWLRSRVGEASAGVQPVSR